MRHRVAVIPGDGIGNEVVPEAIRVLERAGEIWGFGFDWTFFDWGCEYFLKMGSMMTEDGLEQLREHDAIFLGAVGYPEVPDHVSLWGLLIPIRRGFRQYINLRPVRLFEGIESPLRGVAPENIDMVVVRENNEGATLSSSPERGGAGSPRRPSPTASSTPCRFGTRSSGSTRPNTPASKPTSIT
jgi:tartrate dehydrogenase/decarboxylase/D-malate dehydrogenase